MTTVILGIGGAMLVVAVALVIVRIERGPSMLDRTIALDLLVGMVIVCLAIVSAVTGRTDLVNVLVVLTLVSFVGSVTLARFVSVEPEDAGRIQEPEEITRSDERFDGAMAREDVRRGDKQEEAIQRADPEGIDPEGTAHEGTEGR